MKNPLRVHICVVGFELDRISKAAIMKNADIVYLISQEKNDKGKGYLDENKKRLEKEGIPVIIEFVESISDLSNLLGAIKKIIGGQTKENYIYINISSGSTLSAIAGTISSMMLEKDMNIIPYYVKPKLYFEDFDESNKKKLKKAFGGLEPRSIGVKEINEIPTFPIRLPNKELIIILQYLQSKDGPVTKKDLIDFSKKNDYLKTMRDTNRSLAGKLDDQSKNKGSDEHIDESKQKARDYAWLNQNFISKLKDEWNLIDIEKIGKFTCIKLNEKGKKMLDYLNY
ncbi:hypothetical protein FTO70_10480 [Methanosarcina sp. KYL-1]|uniref:HFX_2341 family transcriptional regulator domain-containing protein n=1 Tax=Methanosarcina sp. KYL-1 TaxID=2602068 RepID=UPI002101B1AA|nr:DUF6293 family protein [Methanosarcina sp. KYL-1]MCQ1536097.1 hypothetical protein [Methanosarcina sp. KYL-1]